MDIRIQLWGEIFYFHRPQVLSQINFVNKQYNLLLHLVEANTSEIVLLRTATILSVKSSYLSFFTSHLTNRKQVSSTKSEAEKDGVQVPTTLAEYCVSTKPKPPESHVDMADFYDDDYMEDDDEDEEDQIYDDDEDSGNEES